MNALWKVARFTATDIFRSKWLPVYTVFFFLIAEGLFRFSGDSGQALVSLTNITILLIPAASIIYGALYFYGAREFIELLLAQPVGRKPLFTGLFSGIAGALGGGFLIGTGLPCLLHGTADDRITILAILSIGVMLTLIFVALALLVAVRSDEKVRGVGICLGLWLAFAILYDGLIWLVLALFADYPLERAAIVMTTLNPIDLGRVGIMLRLDIAALMGYTGAVFEQFFGSRVGFTLTSGAMLAWIVAPFMLALRSFSRKDF
ncbi:ABC transporter permease subunit [Ignavibacteria bacterium]|nr:ABC transporter permease subunit [Bacteroidota bacterium]MCZ2132539.1 ABC transporter permease [Bacteroidota bacterium]